MSTTVIYNGVELNDCETTTFEQEIVQDKSNSDTLYSKFTIGVTSTLVGFVDSADDEHPQQIKVPVTGSSEIHRGGIAEQIRAVHQKLSERGKDFWYLIRHCPTDQNSPAGGPNVMIIATGDRPNHGTDQIQVDPTLALAGTVDLASVVDVDNGPKTSDVKVQQIFGGRTMRVSITFEICRKICDPNGTPPNPEVPGLTQAESDALLIDSGSAVLNNRWSISESKDVNWKTTRVLEGLLRVSSPSAIAHAQRYLCVPPLLRGYQRVSQSFVVDPTGLNLKYRIEDKQQHAAPPRPAIAWSGTVTESAAKEGTLQYSEFHFSLTGPPGVDKAKLVGVAGQLIAQRMTGTNKDPTNPDEAYAEFLEGVSFIDVIDQPKIQVRIRIKRIKSQTGDLFGARVKDFNRPFLGEVPPLPPGYTPQEETEHDRLTATSIEGYDHEVWPVPHFQDRPDAKLIGIFTGYAQHPCSPFHNVLGGSLAKTETQSTRPSTDEEEYGTDSDVRVYSSDKELKFDDSRVSKELQRDYPFTYIKIRTEYIFDDGVVHLPYADSDIGPKQPTSVAIQLHSGLCQRVFKMEASRIGKMPVLPKPLKEFTDANGIKETRMQMHLGLSAPEFHYDEVTQEYRAMIEYRYALSRPPEFDEQLRMATSPIDVTIRDGRTDPNSSQGTYTTTATHNEPADRYIHANELFDENVIES